MPAFAQNLYIPVKGSAWHIQVADVDGDNQKELIYATFDGFVRCQRLSDNSLIWEQTVNSFPYDLKVADVFNV